MDDPRRQWWRPQALPGVEVLNVRTADYSHEKFMLHTGYTVKISHGGATAPVRYRGQDHTPGGTGTVTVVEPDEIMQALDTSTTTVDIRVLLVEAAHLQDVGRQAALPRFRQLTYADHSLFNDTAALHNSLAWETDQLTLQSRFAILIANLVGRHAVASDTPAPASRTRELRQVRQILHEQLDANITLDELAALAGCSRYHLIRSFRQAYGAPPHRYRTLLRLARARQLLTTHRSVAEVAAELGYFDQSQLNRHFRQAYGMSAGAYAKACGR